MSAAHGIRLTLRCQSARRHAGKQGSAEQMRFLTAMQCAVRWCSRLTAQAAMKKFNPCSHCSLYCFQIVQVATIEVNKPLGAIGDPTAWRIDRVDADLR